MTDRTSDAEDRADYAGDSHEQLPAAESTPDVADPPAQEPPD